jgi:hypothetical protein
MILGIETLRSTNVSTLHTHHKCEGYSGAEYVTEGK